MRILYTFLVLSVFLVAVPNAMEQEPPEVLPRVIQHAARIYPPLARQTRIDGDVRLKFTTDGESVVDVVVESGHSLLRQAAEDNVRTWKFVAHTPGTFHVTFRYKLGPGDGEITYAESTAIVQIEAPPVVISLDDMAWIGLGTWKTQLKSAHGESWRVLKLYFSGPHEDWLDGKASGPRGESEEIDYGHKEGNFLAFTMKVRQPDGQHIKTFFVGKMSKYRIVGTFVDSAGITGEWTAVRLADSPNSR